MIDWEKFNMIKQSKFDVLYGDYSSKNDILLSIVIPTFNRGDLLVQAIQSALESSKDFTEIEVIVLSNNPQDNLKILDCFKNTKLIVLRNEENLGMSGNLCKCGIVAHGKYISFLHDDDLIDLNYCRSVIKLLNENENIDCYIPARKIIYSNDEWGIKQKKKQKIKSLCRAFFESPFVKHKQIKKISIVDAIKSGRNCFNSPTCGTIYKKSMFEKFGGFCNQWKFAFDLEFYDEFSKKCNVFIGKTSLGSYRMYESASNKDNVQFEFFEALKNILDSNNVKKNYYEYLYLFYSGLSSDADDLIKAKYNDLLSKSKRFKYLFLKIKTNLYFFSKGLDIEY